MKIRQFFKKHKWWIITGILLLIIPIIVLVIMFKFDCINKSDIAEIVGGCLGYYGTVVLGVVAVIQTQISLKQSEKTFIADKYSYIKILGDCTFQIISNDETTYYNQHNYPVNQYFVKLNNDFKYDKTLNHLNIKLFYKSFNYPIKSIKLRSVTGNYKDKYYINDKIKTDLCECPQLDCGQLEIVFMLNQTNLDKLNQLFNDGQFIFVFEFEITSSFDVKIIETIEVNFSSLRKNQEPKEFSKKELSWTVGTTSYRYSEGEKL